MSIVRSSPLSFVWPLLIVVPIVLVGILILAPLGDYGEGLWAEFFASDQMGFDTGGEVARAVKVWTVGTLLVAFAIALAVYYWTIQSWRSKLRRFDVEAVVRYLRFVWVRVGIAFLLSAVVAVFALAISAPLQDSDPPRWVIFVTAVGLFGSLEFLMLTFGLPKSRALYLGG